MPGTKNLYNAYSNGKEAFLEGFVIRHNELEIMLRSLRRQQTISMQHYIITGKRGLGKSTLLRRVFHAVEDEAELRNKIIPIMMGAEQYGLSRLYRLWEQVIAQLAITWPELEAAKAKIAESKDYETLLPVIISDWLAAQQKTLLLLIDNFDQLINALPLLQRHQLREVLIQYPIQIIGNSVFYGENFEAYAQPFYEFFKPIQLKPLNKEEAQRFITEKARLEGVPDVEALLKKQHGKIQALRILSGGVPRTLLLLVRIISKNNAAEVVDYLQEMIDNVTPLYQDRMRALSPQQREIMYHLAICWDRTPVKELAAAMRLPSKTVSAQLVQLEASGYVNKINTAGRNHYYEIDERFFNIWLLMSEAPAHDARRVKWLTKSLDIIYEQQELEDFARFQLNSMSDGYHYKNFLMAQAMAASEKLSHAFKQEIVDNAEAMLKGKVDGIERWAADFRNCEMNFSDIEETLIDRITGKIESKLYDEAEKLLAQMEKTKPGLAYYGLGFIYDEQGKREKAEEYYMMAVEKGHTGAMNSLALLYENVRQEYNKAEEYYIMAVEKAHTGAMYNLASMFENVNQDYDKAEKYYQMAVDRGHTGAMFNLALIYQDVKQDYEKAEYFYLMATEKGHTGAMFNLALLYYNIRQKYDEAEKYYLLAAKKGHNKSLNNLGLLYKNIKKEYGNSEKYYLMAVDKGYSDAMNNVAMLYENVKQEYDKAEKYYLMAIAKGHREAMNNLAVFYFYERTQKKSEAAGLSEMSLQNTGKKYRLANIIFKLWAEKFEMAFNTFMDIIKDQEQNTIQDNHLFLTLQYFLVFKQRHSLLKFFNLAGLDLKDKHKPLYYALLHEMKEEYPKEYLKMTSELEEPVHDILAFVNKERARLGVSVS